jgi:pimeloyl-ACP methyl ester carboxylesterase
MKGQIIKTRLGDIEYRSIGKGRPVLFIHGGHSNCHESLGHKGFDTKRFQLITPSRPGYGRTPLDNNRRPKQAADLIAGLIKHLSLENLIVYGISAGGLTAIELARHYPAKVRKLILASAISKKWLDENEKTYKMAQRIFNPKVEKITWGMLRFFSKVFPGGIAKSFYPQFSNMKEHSLRDEDVKALIAALKHYNSGAGFLNDIDQTISDSTIGAIECPTLIVHSRNDNSVSFEHAVHANKRIANSMLLELENEWGHLFWLGKDSTLPIKEILAFIEE